MGVDAQCHAPAALPPGQKKNPVPIVQEAGWASAAIWMGAENLAPPGFDPQTVQPVASRYTNYATPAHESNKRKFNKLFFHLPIC
jgi:hypothetical protein